VAGLNGYFLGNLPILDGMNWDKWCAQMKVIFGFEDVCEVVQNGCVELSANPTDRAGNESS